MLQPWRNGTIVRIENESANTRRFWIQVSELDVFDYAPGQFVTLDLPIHEQKNKRWRSYSIASAPDGTNTFELIIVKLEGGAGTTYLFDEAGIGTVISLRGPQGKFTLPETIEKDLYLICTGTGIAPFNAMVHHIFNKQIPHKDIHLIFGCRKYDDVLYEKSLIELEHKLEGFHYHPVFSREEAPGKHHRSRTGYVHNVYEDLALTKKMMHEAEESLHLGPAHFYLCGWKNMVDEAKQRILQLGYDKKDIHLELYG
jgi:CDP-4-dehydro-6-deoxyglucose reductase